MSDIVRFTITIGDKLLENFDDLIKRKGYVNRSEAIREIIRNFITESEWEEGNKELFGTITLIYNHEVKQVNEVLNSLQHNYHNSIISSLHVHLDRHNCLEVVVVKGKSSLIKDMALKLKSVRGVNQVKVTLGTTERALS